MRKLQIQGEEVAKLHIVVDIAGVELGLTWWQNVRWRRHPYLAYPDSAGGAEKATARQPVVPASRKISLPVLRNIVQYGLATPRQTGNLLYGT